MRIDVIHIYKNEESQNTSMYFDLEEKPGTSHNSGYMVPLRFTQIFAPLRSAKTSYSRGTLCFMLKKTVQQIKDRVINANAHLAHLQALTHKPMLHLAKEPNLF